MMRQLATVMPQLPQPRSASDEAEVLNAAIMDLHLKTLGTWSADLIVMRSALGDYIGNVKNPRAYDLCVEALRNLQDAKNALGGAINALGPKP